MHKLCTISATVLLGLGLAACSHGQPGGSSATATNSSLDLAINHALDHAETQLTTQDFTLTGRGSAGQLLPDAKITPKGDLVIAGKPVPLTPAQRQQVLAYRQQGIVIGEAGIAIGRDGATLGLSAAKTAIAAVFAGKSDQQVRQQVEAQTADIRAATVKLCAQLPALLTAQQQLAIAVPAFKPYATMTQKDVTDCSVDAQRDAALSRGPAVAPAAPGTR